MTRQPTPPDMQPLPNERNRVPSTSEAIIEPVDKRLFGTLPSLPLGHVYVTSYRDGHLRTFHSTPAWSDVRSARSCLRIDTTERSDRRFCTLRSSVDAYSFSVNLGAIWRVTNPEAAAVAGPGTGGAVVLDTMEQEAWQIARTFSPREPAQVEEAIRAQCSGLVLGSCGITVIRAWARFTGDSRISEAVAGLDEEQYKSEVVQKRLRDLTSVFGPETRPSMLYHLAQHPEDTASVLADEASRSEHNRSGFFQLLDRLLSHNLLNDADAQALRDRVLSGPASFESSSVGATVAGPPATMMPVRHKPSLSLPQGLDDDDPDDAGQHVRAPDSQPSGDGITWEPIRRPRQGDT